MLNSVFDLFKVGVGPSSSHTNGPMVAAYRFREEVKALFLNELNAPDLRVVCVLTGSLAYTGPGHGTEKAILLGLNGYLPHQAAEQCEAGNYEALLADLFAAKSFTINGCNVVKFDVSEDIQFELSKSFVEHPNGIVLSLVSEANEVSEVLFTQTYFSIGGGFVRLKGEATDDFDVKSRSYPYAFVSAKEVLDLAAQSHLCFSSIQLKNEIALRTEEEVLSYLDYIISTMFECLERGLREEGQLPGGLGVSRRAKNLYAKIKNDPLVTDNDWLCAYAMAVNEENAAGHSVVTAPTNGAAGVVPAVLYFLAKHKSIAQPQLRDFLLTATLIGSLIKHGSSISGAEVGCQGEVGSASAMAAAGCCAVMGGTPEQIENAAEIALEHHLGMTCDPVGGLVQVPCIERNGFGAIKAIAASSLALHGDGKHLISLDSCIAAMKQTGEEMSEKFKETSQGGLAVKWVDC